MKLKDHVSSKDGQWTIKGFIDIYKNVYTISSDTKIVSKILEIHLFPKLLEFASKNNFQIILANHQNYYPDLTFQKKDDPAVRFALDLKTTYRNPSKPRRCNGFTLGSHGEYFINRTSTKNIQFPYATYLGHFCLGIIYDRVDSATIDETRSHHMDKLLSIASVVKNFQFFVSEKWKIASDQPGSGNTANIGSINIIEDIVSGRGMFSKLGETWFDDYWMNFNKITRVVENSKKGGSDKIKTLKDFVEYRKGDISLIINKGNAQGKKQK